jgi:hypothetical protein
MVSCEPDTSEGTFQVHFEEQNSNYCFYLHHIIQQVIALKPPYRF